MSVRLFGTDGMRGRVNKYPMTPEVALRLGLAAGTFYRDKNRRSRVVIGKDTRLSGYVFENALAAGLLAAGMPIQPFAIEKKITTHVNVISAMKIQRTFTTFFIMSGS